MQKKSVQNEHKHNQVIHQPVIKAVLQQEENHCTTCLLCILIYKNRVEKRIVHTHGTNKTCQQTLRKWEL